MITYHLYLWLKNGGMWPDLYYDWLGGYVLLCISLYFCARSWLLHLWYQKRASWIQLGLWPICILFLSYVLFVVAPSHRTPGIHVLVLIGGTLLLTVLLSYFSYFECEIRGFVRPKRSVLDDQHSTK